MKTNQGRSRAIKGDQGTTDIDRRFSFESIRTGVRDSASARVSTSVYVYDARACVYVLYVCVWGGGGGSRNFFHPSRERSISLGLGL